MPPATISSSASEHFRIHATLCRHCAHDGTTSRNRCNCQPAPAVSSRHLSAREKLEHEALHHHAELACRLRADVERLHASCATLVGPMRERRSENLPKTHVDLETRCSGNDRVLRERKDRQSNHRSRLRLAVYPVWVERCRMEDFGWENANWLGLR